MAGNNGTIQSRLNEKMNLTFSQKLGIWGFGIVGQSALRFARKHDCTSIIIVDTKANADSYIPESDRPFVQFFTQTPETIATMLEICDFIIPSPGIDLRNYQDYKDKFVTELDIFQHYTTISTIAITGSVGKTTLTTLLGSLLEQAEILNKTGGNIGNGMLDLIIENEPIDYAILELSSFQLEQSQQFCPRIGIISNIHPNHLDRHETMYAYAQAKLNMLRPQTNSDFSILPWELQELVCNTHQFQSRKIWHHQYELSHDFILAYTSSESLYGIFENSIVALSNASIRHIIPLSQLPEISLIANWIILIATLETLNIDTRTLITPHMPLHIPEHRIELVATYRDISFYNDSKATIPAATLAAVEKLNAQQLVLFIGGVSKGVDRAPLLQSLEGKTKSIYCFGSEAAQLVQYARANNLNALQFENLEQAVDFYFNHAQPSDTVLFSPAGASFDLFTDYKNRGTAFKELVKKYIGKQQNIGV